MARWRKTNKRFDQLTGREEKNRVGENPTLPIYSRQTQQHICLGFLAHSEKTKSILKNSKTLFHYFKNYRYNQKQCGANYCYLLELRFYSHCRSQLLYLLLNQHNYMALIEHCAIMLNYYRERSGFNADPLEPGNVKFRAPKSDNLSFNMRPPGVRFGRRCEASTHKRWGSHPYEYSNFPQRAGVRILAYTQADTSARGRTPECGGPISIKCQFNFGFTHG